MECELAITFYEGLHLATVDGGRERNDHLHQNRVCACLDPMLVGG